MQYITLTKELLLVKLEGQNCTICQNVFAMPIQNCFKKQVGTLWFLLIPNRHWEVCPMDLMASLPPSKGFDLIMVGMVKLNKMVHFIPIVKITSTLKTRLFLHMFNITMFQKTLCLIKSQNSQVNFNMLCRIR